MRNASIEAVRARLVVFAPSFVASFLTPEVKCSLLSSIFSQILIYLPPFTPSRDKASLLGQILLTHLFQSASFVAMDFEEDQPLWGGSRQEEEDVYFGKFHYADEYESPYHPSKLIVCVVLA